MNGRRIATAAPLALSVKQPWAELIMMGNKSIEVRSWTTDHRGPLFIHTGQKPAADFLEFFSDVDASFRGGFIGIVDLVDIEPFRQASWSRLRPEHLVPGPMPQGYFGWRLANPRRLMMPIRWSGALGLFQVPSLVADAPLQDAHHT
ncbi:ASCH domain-containing protein [Azospirillum palustre]